jgi:hypothetical protein
MNMSKIAGSPQDKPQQVIFSIPFANDLPNSFKAEVKNYNQQLPDEVAEQMLLRISKLPEEAEEEKIKAMFFLAFMSMSDRTKATPHCTVPCMLKEVMNCRSIPFPMRTAAAFKLTGAFAHTLFFDGNSVCRFLREASTSNMLEDKHQAKAKVYLAKLGLNQICNINDDDTAALLKEMSESPLLSSAGRAELLHHLCLMCLSGRSRVFNEARALATLQLISTFTELTPLHIRTNARFYADTMDLDKWIGIAD